MKAKVSGQYQGSGGKQSIEIDGSVEIIGLSELFVRVKSLEETVVDLTAKLQASTSALEALVARVVLLEKEEERESKEEASAQEKAAVDANSKKPAKKS
jgi:hypothetical protein